MSSKKISELPMVIGEEQAEIKVNMILYKVRSENMGSPYRAESFTGRGDVFIDTYRVITVNQTHRHFRIRSAKGCEQEYSLKEGCVSGLYPTITGARRAAKERFNKDISNLQEVIKKGEKAKKALKILKTKQIATKALKASKKPREIR